MWSTLLLVGLLLLALLAVYVGTRPDAFSISRTARIAAPPAGVFPLVNDLHRWDDWSPWAKLDPTAKSSFTGDGAGPGTSFAWDGNNQVGKGSMTIVDSKANEFVRLRLDFEKPMRATNEAVFTFAPDGDGTRVTWTMSGRNKFMAKAMNLVIDCDRMVGGMFDKGLATLKGLAEAKR